MAGCFTLILYGLAVLLTLLVPLALRSMVNYAPIQLVSAVSCWLVPVGLFTSFWLGRRVLIRSAAELASQTIEFEDTVPMTKAQRIVLIWLTVDAWVLFIWLSLAMAFGQVEGPAMIWLAVFVVSAAFLSVIIGYALGYLPFSDRRKFSVIVGALFTVVFGAAFFYQLITGWQEDYLVRWGTLVGSFISFLTIYYLHGQWNPAAIENPELAPEPGYFDVLFLTNGCFRFLYIAALAGGFILITAIGEGFAITVISAWISMFFGYLSVRAWRSRPSIHKKSIYKSGS